MMILDTPIHGLKVIEFGLIRDNRGHFARTFCVRSFELHGLKAPVSQANLSFGHYKGTIRGLHFQIPPAAETKLMRCTRGAIMDIAIDLRPESATFLQHFSVELTADNYKALYVPERFANGYQALTDGAEAAYQVSEFYTPGYERGLRFSDPRLKLPWPTEPTIVSEKDRNWPLLDDERIASIRHELGVCP
jgi:dTDP-4-dehydrorhamnose 3,5-epimerase